MDELFAPPIFAIFELLILDTLIFRKDPLMDDMDEINALDPSRLTKVPEFTFKFCILALKEDRVERKSKEDTYDT